MVIIKRQGIEISGKLHSFEFSSSSNELYLAMQSPRGRKSLEVVVFESSQAIYHTLSQIGLVTLNEGAIIDLDRKSIDRIDLVDGVVVILKQIFIDEDGKNVIKNHVRVPLGVIPQEAYKRLTEILKKDPSNSKMLMGDIRDDEKELKTTKE